MKKSELHRAYDAFLAEQRAQPVAPLDLPRLPVVPAGWFALAGLLLVAGLALWVLV